MIKLRVFTVLAAFVLLAATPAWADLKIDINQGRVAPMPIAISPFYGAQAQEGQIGQDITSVISADLDRSGLFRSLDPKAFIQTPQALLSQLPRFADWRAINAQALVHGDVAVQGDGRVKIEFRLWDVYGEAQMEGRVYTTALPNWRRVAHIIADAIYQRITGEEGYFDTQIVYISESGPLQRRIKRLAIMDQDSANHRFLTDGRSLVLTPRFSPTAREITYLAYVNNKPRVYLYNVDTGQQELLGDFPGMTFAPRFSPDGNRVIMSMAQNGNSDIYTMDLRTHHVQRLTDDPAIDTSPCYSPDGSQVVFNSDRSGSQQLYVMQADGSNVHRISFGSGRYATPVWSPRGDLIAFTKITEGDFYIGVMRPDGSGERLLTKAFLVEGPTWAPNGRVLMYFKQEPSDSRGHGGGSHLYSIDLTGYNEREISTPADGSDPAWSGLLP
jgi:TolB protein